MNDIYDGNIFSVLRKRNEERERQRTLLPVAAPKTTPDPEFIPESDLTVINSLDSYFLGVAEKHGIDLGNPDLDDQDFLDF